jgi:1-hydroxy-2-methyl-2-(E)-butenyl 4-diphosphate synthase
VLTLLLPYVLDLFSYRRRRTREVMVGDVGVGGDNPIRIQSMTTTLTKDIDATVAQTERLVRAGCEIVRITTPTPSDARCLGPIKEKLAARGIRVPIVADIHFSPAAALAAADFADKVRVNPGNYTDSRKFAVREWSDEEYGEDLQRVEDRFTPLVLRCSERGISMRIGTNHGSLSDRIMNRFGDTPEGMVESALEFVRVCEKHGYHDIILSMKASNPKVMIAAYRLLAARLAELDMDYPFHLGVTEAGNAKDGRIKSAIGIGSLLEDGIGDTIRVSLTEEPEEEIPVARAIASRYDDRAPQEPAWPPRDVPWDPYHYERRPACELEVREVKLGGSNTVAVFTSIESPRHESTMAHVLRWASPAGRRQPKPDGTVIWLRDRNDLDVLQQMSERLAKWPQARLALIAAGGDPGWLAEALEYCDAILWRVSGERVQYAPTQGETGATYRPDGGESVARDSVPESTRCSPLIHRGGERAERRHHGLPGTDKVVDSGGDGPPPPSRERSPALQNDGPSSNGAGIDTGVGDGDPSYIASASDLLTAVRDARKALILEAQINDAGTVAFGIERLVEAAADAWRQGIKLILSLDVPASERIHAYRLLAARAAELGIDAPILLNATASEEPLLPEAITLGSPLCDGIGDAVMIGGMEDSSELSFNILQAAGTRIFKTDYVACPSCGRTLFDLQETTDRIKQRTSHLVGVRLAIMGCIVNGPGEMADADFGYVGGAPGQVNLYVGKECVEKGVPAEVADDRLIELIKTYGKWVEEDPLSPDPSPMLGEGR